MPVRYPKRRRFVSRRTRSVRKFGYRRKRFSRMSRTRIQKARIPTIAMADQTMVKLNLDTSFLLTIPSGSAEVSQTIPMSYVNGTGFSAANFPQGLLSWANFYGAFRVLGSKIRVDYAVITPPTTVNGFVPARVVVLPSEGWIGGTSPTVTVGLYAEPYAKYLMLQGSATGGNANDARHVITSFMSSKKMFGQKIANDSDFQQNFTYSSASPNLPNALSNPTERIEWVLSAGTGDNAVTTLAGVILATVKVTYYIRLEDRLNQQNSFGPSP